MSKRQHSYIGLIEEESDSTKVQKVEETDLKASGWFAFVPDNVIVTNFLPWMGRGLLCLSFTCKRFHRLVWSEEFEKMSPPKGRKVSVLHLFDAWDRKNKALEKFVWKYISLETFIGDPFYFVKDRVDIRPCINVVTNNLRPMNVHQYINRMVVETIRFGRSQDLERVLDKIHGKKKSTNRYPFYALPLACFCGNMDMIKHLCTKKCMSNLSDEFFSLLVLGNSLDVIRELNFTLPSGTLGVNTILAAIASGDRQKVVYLKSKGVNCNRDDLILLFNDHIKRKIKEKNYLFE
jgi:hypothetical protein